MKTPEEIAATIDRYNLDDRESLRELETHIRKSLPIREILLFAEFLHGGDFISSSGKWRRNSSGYVTQTHQEDAALTRLWEALVRSCYITIGAASVLKMQDSRFLAGCAFADEGDGLTLYDYPLDALVGKVPKEYQKQLDAAARAEAAAYKGAKEGAKEGSKEGVQTTLPKVYFKTLNMSDEEVRASIKPKSRKPGGGRKQTKDIGDKQVRAVLADMNKHRRESFRAHSEHIIRTMKDGDYTNPYSTAKDLDAAVRRYCKKHHITPPALTNRTGKWRSTK